MRANILWALIALVALHATAHAQEPPAMRSGDPTSLFGPPITYPAGYRPQQEFGADLDGDGDHDLAVANWWGSEVSILLNHGDGTFAPRVAYATGRNSLSVFSADFDGDGAYDLAVGNYSSNTVSVLMNRGNGTFANKVDYEIGRWPGGIFSADLDGDGDKDLAVSRGIVHSVAVLLNQSSRTPVQATKDLITTIESLEFSQGIGTSLKAPLEGAIDALERGNEEAAVGKLSAFIQHVEAQRRKKLTTEEADSLIETATGILASIASDPAAPAAKITLGPRGFCLHQNCPNPFNPQTVIHYDLPVRSHVNISIYSMTGQKVATLVDGERPSGRYFLVWDGRDHSQQRLASGVYVYRMEADGFVQTRKLILVR